MTENEIKETKEWLQDFIRTFGCNFDDLETRSFNECVMFLKELEQYRAIGTVEECEKAMDFELAKQDKMFAEVIDDYLKYIKIGTIEEFKALSSASELWEHNNHLAYMQGRKDVIDEFVERLKGNTGRGLITNWDKPYGISYEKIDEIAEQLKAGGKNE